MSTTHTDTLPPAANTLGKRIRQARQYALMDQEELAEKISASRNSVGNWERGRFSPTVEDVVRIAAATGFRPGWFLDGLEPPPPVTQRYRAFLKAA